MGNQAAFSNDSTRVEGDDVRAWFAEPVAVEHYARAVHAVGLWRSETVVLTSVFTANQKLLDVGCGAGRVALGLWSLGYRDITGIDFCEPLIAEARAIAQTAGIPISFEVGDACALPFGDDTFEGAIFAFNGLMQIPGSHRRRAALQEIARVVGPGGYLVFTTHDIDRVFRTPPSGTTAPDPSAAVGVDRVLNLPEGRVFMHVPTRREVLADLASSGWRLVEDHARHELANEPPAVREFSDDCRFWIACRNPV